jgi:hypothetical protein
MHELSSTDALLEIANYCWELTPTHELIGHLIGSSPVHLGGAGTLGARRTDRAARAALGAARRADQSGRAQR